MRYVCIEVSYSFKISVECPTKPGQLSFFKHLNHLKGVCYLDKDKLKRLGKALPKLYLNRFRNTHLNTVSTDITTVLDHLFIAHGDIEPELLDEKKST